MREMIEVVETAGNESILRSDVGNQCISTGGYHWRPRGVLKSSFGPLGTIPLGLTMRRLA